jgi:MFS family permease
MTHAVVPPAPVALADRPAAGARRWWVLATVVAAQFMFGVDAFIVNVALPTIQRELNAGPAELEAVVALYLIGYATLVVTGGRLGDLFGLRRVFMLGVAAFTLTSLACGLSQTGPQLIMARLAQGASAALMVPQVLATLHVLFNDGARPRAFAIYGIVLGLAGAVGFLLGGVLVSLDPGGFGWRGVFFVNGPVGAVIWLAAWRLVPQAPPRAATRLDLAGALLLFSGLLGLIGPLLFGREAGWPPSLWAAMAGGAACLVGFVAWERALAARGGAPLVAPALLVDGPFTRGLLAVFCFFFANLSFYLVMTLYLQSALGLSPLAAGCMVLPLALAFVVASRQAAGQVQRRGTRVLLEGCVVEGAGLVAIAAVIVAGPAHPGWLAMAMALFGYGQGLLMAPLSSAVLAHVAAARAGAGAGLYGTTTQVANAAGVAVIGSVFFALRDAAPDRTAVLVALACVGAALLASAGFLVAMRRAAAAVTAGGS